MRISLDRINLKADSSKGEGGTAWQGGERRGERGPTWLVAFKSDVCMYECCCCCSLCLCFVSPACENWRQSFCELTDFMTCTHTHTQRQTTLAHLHSRCIGTPTQQGHAHTGRTCHTVDSWIKAIKMRKSCYFIFIIRKQKQKRSCLRIMPSWSMYYICVSVRQCVCEWAWLLLRLLCILLGALKVCFSNWIMHLMAQAKGRDRAPERERVEEREWVKQRRTKQRDWQLKWG